ncbi:MAG: Ig-like domain-containing protein [Acidimicrobiales bacterium]
MGRSKLGVLFGAPIVMLLLLWGAGGVGPASAGGSSPAAFIYLSSTTGGSVGGVSFADEDVVVYDTVADTWELFFDGSDVLPASADVNGFSINDDNTMLLSFQAPVTIAGLGTVDDSDVLLFTPTSTGPNTAGTLTMAVDGSTVGLTTSNEEINALVSPLGDSDLIVSTLGGFNVPKTGGGNLTGVDEDLIGLTGATWDIQFDGSDVSLATEDLWGAWIDPDTGQVYGASLNGFSVPGLTGDGDDVFTFTGVTGPATSGTFAKAFDGDAHGFGGEQIDALHLELQAPPPPGDADLSITKVDDVDPVLPGDLVIYTVTVNNAGPDTAEKVVVTDTLPAGVTLAATNGCAQDPSALTCSLGSIPVNGSAQYTITVIVDANTAGVLSNSATVAAGTADPDPNNNTTTEDTLVGSAPTATDDGPATNSMVGDPYHTATDIALAATAPGLLGNDSLGDPAAQVASFGGGDSGGDAASNAPGASVAVGDGSITINADGSFAFEPPTGFDGVFTVDYRLENVLGSADATLSIFVGERLEVEGGDLIYLSSTSFGTVDGIDFDDEDVLVFDNALDTWALYFDGTDVLPAGADVNAFYIEADGNLLMSFQNPVTIAGLGTVDDSDIVRFNPTTLGEATTGFFSTVLDGTGVGLTTSAEEISALTAYDGNHVVSTAGSFNVPLTAGGNQLGRDEDLIVNTGPGTWTLLFDGSDVDFASEDIAGVSYDEQSQAIYATSFNGYNVPGLAGDNNDVIVFSGNFGDPTSGTFSTFFDGDAHGIGNEQLDALHVVLNRNDTPEANPDRAATDENTPITIGPDYTTSISSDGGEISKIAADPRTGNYVVLDVVSSLVRVRVYDPVNRRVLHTTTIASLGPAAAVPGGVDVDLRTGNVVVAESRSSTVTVFDPTLSTVLDSETVAGLGSVRAVTVDPFTGNIIVGGQDLSRIYTPGFASSTDVDHNGLIATGFDVDERNGEIVAVLYEDQGGSAPGQIQRWESDGSLIQTVTTQEMDFPADLSVEQPTGDIAVANFSACCSGVVTFDENGNTESIIGGLSEPSGVAYDPMTGHLAVADDGGSLVNPTTGALLDSFLDRRGRTMAVQPVSEEILAISGPSRHPRLVTLDPTTRTRLGLDERFVVDVATDPTTGRIAVIIGEAIAPRVLEIYDPTGSTLLHSTSVPGASVAFHPDTGEVAVSLRTGEFRLYDPTLTTVLTSFPFASTDSLGVQPGTGNIVTRFGLSEVRIFDDGGSRIGSIMPSPPVSDFAVDPTTGNIAEASTNVEVWDPTGTTILDSIPAPSVGGSAVGVAYGGTGNLIIGYSNHGPLDVMARGVLANDTDPDGDPLTVTGFDATSANGAAVTVNPDGSFTYDPTGVPAIEALGAGETLADTFTYTIGDGNGETDTATATVFVAGVNDAPILGGPAAITVAENTTAVADYNATDDTNSEGSGLTYSFIGEVDGERLSINTSTGVLQFNPPADFENPDDANQDNVYEIVVGVTDSDGLSDALNVTVTVTDVVETGSITIVQDTVPDWATDFSFTGGLGAFSLDDDAAAPSNGGDNTLSNTFEATLLEPGVYTVTQSAVSPFVVTSLDCTGGSTSTDTGTRTATITLAAGDAVTCTFTTEPSSDVSVILSDSPDPIVAGQTLDYLFGFSTSFPMSNPVLTLDLPAGVTYVGALNGFDSFCSETAPGFVTCDGFNGLWVGATFRIEVMVDAGTVGSISATGSVSFTGVFDPNLANNTATVTTTVTAPDLPPTLVSSTPSEGGTIEPDDDLMLTFSEPVTLVESAGPAFVLFCESRQVILTATGGPTVFTLLPDTDLPPGETCNLTLVPERIVDQDGAPDSLVGNRALSFQVAPRVDLSITKTDSADPVTAGGSLTYTIAVSNAGPQAATNVVVTEALPAGVTFVSTSGCNEDPAGVPTCSLGDITSGGSASFTVNVTVDSGTTGTIVNSASVTATETDPNPADNSTTQNTTVNEPAGLAVTKIDSLVVDVDNDGEADPGDTLRYEVIINNTSSSARNNVVFTDTIDSNTTLVGTVHVSPLAVDDSYTSEPAGITITPAQGLLLNDADPDNNVSLSVNAVNGNPAAIGNPEATSQAGSVTVASNGSFVYTPASGFLGDDTFTYTLTDGDPLTIDDTDTVTITVSDPPPPGIGLDSGQSDSGSDTLVTATVLTQSLGTLEPGQQVQMVFDVTVNDPRPASGEVCNQATVTMVGLDPVSSDDPGTSIADDATCTPIDEPDPVEAVADAYDSLGNVGITVPTASGVLVNDLGGTAANAATAAAGATAQGGAYSLAVDGSFSYNPAPGFEGDDTFTYTINDGNGGTDTGTVTITVDEVIWFIDGGEASNGNGTLSSPFKTIDGVGGYEATAADDPNDVIYVADDPTPYNGPLNLKNDQILLGDGSVQDIPTAAGITVPPHSNALPMPGGSTLDRPLIGTTAGHAVNLAKDNTVRGFLFGNTAGHAIVGSDFGKLVLDDAAITGTGGSLDLVTGEFEVDLNCIQASTTSSTRPTLRLRDVEGPFNVSCTTTATLSATSGQAVDILGRLEYPIGPGDVLDVNNLIFASVSVDGATTGIHLQDIVSGSFTVIGTGTADGSGGTLQNISANGIYVENVNGATFKNMNLTGASFTDGVSPVPGSTCDRLDTGTNTGCHGAVKLSNTGPVVLDNLHIDDTAQNGVTGNGVDDLTLTNSVFTDIGSNTGAERENALHVINLTGTSSVSGNTFTGNSINTTRNVLIENSTGTLNLTMNDNIIATAASNGVRVRAQDSAVMNIDAVRNTFQTNGGTEFEVNAVGNSTVDVNLGDGTSANENVFIGTPATVGSGGGILIDGRDSAQFTFDILANELRPVRGTGIAVVALDGSQGEGRIIGNEVQGNEQGWGILAKAESTAQSPSMIVDVSTNIVGGVNAIGSAGSGGAGIEVSSVQGSAGAGLANTQAKVHSNTITIGGADSIMQHLADAGNTLCLDVKNNAGSGAATSPFAGGGSTHYIGNPVSGSSNGAGVVHYVGYLPGNLGGSWNANGNTPAVATGIAGEAFVDGTEPTATASCTAPSNN